MRSCSGPCSRSSSVPPLLLPKLFVLLASVLCIAASSMAQDKVELFGGYSYFRASIRGEQLSLGTPCPPNCTVVTQVSPHANLNGWEFSGQYKLLPFIGAVADFNGTYGTLHSGAVHEHTFLFGPQVSLPTRVSPFAHALFGVASESQGQTSAVCNGLAPPFQQCSGFVSLGSDTSFATAIGAGFDIKLAPLVKLRLIQVDYLRTQLHGATQNQARVSAGIVFHF